MMRRENPPVVTGKGTARKPVHEPQLKVAFVLARSFTLSAFALFVDTLRLAGDELDMSRRVTADWQVIGSTRFLISSSCGVQVAPTSDFVDPSRFDYVVVVGGLLNTSMPIDSETMAFLKQAAAKRVPLLGVCTGTFILAEAGLMGNHETCVSWLHYNEFRERFPDLRVRSDRLYSLDRQRGSCAGGSSAVDLAATLVRRHISKDAERNALEVLQVERARSVHDIQPRRPLAIACDDSRVKAALILMESHRGNRIPIKRLAESVGLSRRQLERLFTDELKMSLGNVYKKIMLEKAKRLVQTTSMPLVDIALEFGFHSASTFSRNFKRNFGVAPTSFRAAMTDMSPEARERQGSAPSNADDI